MKKLRRHIIFYFLLFRVITADATHFAGGEMEYKSLGGGKYLIIAKLYRDCRGIAMDTISTTEFGVYAGTNGGNACGSYTIAFKRKLITPAMAVCSTSTNPCIPANIPRSGDGVEMHVFEAIVDFNTTPLKGFLTNSSCCEVTFYAGGSDRPSAITTGSAGNGMYVSCMINVCNLKSMQKAENNSVVFGLPPISYHCCNQALRSNITAYDSLDGDSVSFRLINGLNLLPNNSINYNSPFTPRYPMTPLCIPPGKVDCTPNVSSALKLPRGFYFDSMSGQVVVVPTKCDEVAPIVIEMTEKRKDTLGIWRVTGKTRRDWLIMVKDDCGYNYSPEVYYPANLAVCEGDTLFADINLKDQLFSPYQTVPDTPVLFWVKNLPGATISCLNPGDREKTYRLCWPTRIGFARDNDYRTFFRVSDQHCPRPLLADGAISIKVKKRITLQSLFRNDSCNRLISELKATPLLPGFNYGWKVYDSVNAKLLVSINQTNPVTSFYIPYSGKVIIKSGASNAKLCANAVTDTAVIKPNLWVTLPPDTMLCENLKNTMVFINANAQNPIGTLRYQWTINGNADNADSLQFLNKTIDVPAYISVKVSDAIGCKAVDFRSISTMSGPRLNLGSDREFCQGDTSIIQLYNLYVLPGNRYKYLWSTGESSKEISARVPFKQWLEVSDTFSGCISRDSVEYRYIDSFGKFLGQDLRFCPGSTLQIKPIKQNDNPVTKYSWTRLEDNSWLSSDSFLNISPLQNTCVRLEESVRDYSGNLCVFTDTICLVKFEPFNLKISNVGYCFSENGINLSDISPKFINQKFNASFISTKKNPITTDSNNKYWFSTKALNNKNLYTADYTDKIIVTLPDTGGLSCASSDSFQLTIRHRPEIPLRKIVIGANRETLWMDTFFTTLINRNRYYHEWRCFSAPSGSNASKLLYLSLNPQRNYQFIFNQPDELMRLGNYEFELKLRDYNNGCISYDTAILEVKNSVATASVPQQRLSAWPNPVMRGSYLFLSPDFKCPEYQLTDQSGRVILNSSKPAANNGKIWISADYSPGIYNLKVKCLNNAGLVIQVIITE